MPLVVLPRLATRSRRRTSAPSFPWEAREVAVRGVVQGVGFRPFVHRLADRYDLAGWVRNESGAVRIRIEGPSRELDSFTAALQTELPPLARIDGCSSSSVEPDGLRAFQVIESDTRAVGRLPVSPDVATCDRCEAELRDPQNPRHRYPFITCTDCGPRFTVIEEMPYDRVRTTMRAFRQCPSCTAEYETAADRRYHSETNSCPICGPTVWLRTLDASGEPGRGAEGARVGRPQSDHDAVVAAARLLRAGRIVALRGLGGFHLAVRADDEAAVARLRLRKAREAKPLALMVGRLVDVGRLARVSEAEAEQLLSSRRPIVVLRSKEDCGLAPSVAPGLDSVGVMLPYTPLHHLLLEAMGRIPLVMTSGNVTDEPIAIGNQEALDRLSGIADAFLLHDREIVARYDDSVLRVADHGPVMLRRARGFAPMPLTLPVRSPDAILAMGPHLKNTFTLAEGSDAFVSQHIGDLDSLESQEHFTDARTRFELLFHVEPRWVVRDLHPGYLSTDMAERSGLAELAPVQHHHAHVAAVMGEHGVTDPVLGLAFDGTGYGTDGRVWGCELLVADLVDFRRVGHLRYAPLPGADKAVRSPWRSLLGYASLDPLGGETGSGDEAGSDDDARSGAGLGGGSDAVASWAVDALGDVDPEELEIAVRQIRRSLNAPEASSLGRLFDAAAALLGIRLENAYEGQAAMELEAAAGDLEGRELPFPVRPEEPGGPGVSREEGQEDSVLVLDPVPLLDALAEGLRSGRDVPELAADFHETVAAATAELAVDLSRDAGVDRVALAGGCFQNVRLLDSVAGRLEGAGLEVLLPRELSPNDGAVSYGQAVVAAARLAAEPPDPTGAGVRGDPHDGLDHELSTRTERS